MIRPQTVLFQALLTSLAVAQADQQAAFFAEAKDTLDDYAKLCFESGYPHRASEIWREIIAEYDVDDPAARKALGYKRVGKSWDLDPDFDYPAAGEASLAKAKVLRKRWDRVADDLAKGHLRLAEAFAAAGDADRAGYHYDRVLRFQPGQPQAAAARGVDSFDGLYGKPVELELLKRSRLFRTAVSQVIESSCTVEPVTEPHPAMRRADLELRGFAGPDVTVYGEWDDDVLREAVQTAQRSLALCRLLYAGSASYPRPDFVLPVMCFCKEESTWTKLLHGSRSRFQAEHLQFLEERKPATTIGGDSPPFAMVAAGSPATAYDMACRWVAQTYSGYRTDAMVEGIGHTITGLLLGRNLSFVIGQEQREGTVAGRARSLKLQVPDMAVWQELAIDTAWENTSVPAAQLPFLQAASFPSEGRIKAWSFCHYVMLRDPELLRKLDDMPSDKLKTPYQLRDKFTEAAGIHIDLLDREWREFWIADTPLLREARGGETTPLEAISQEAPLWLEAINEQRQKLNRMVASLKLPDVAWSEEFSEDCRLHVDYLQKNRSERGAGRENTQKLSLEGATNRGRLFAERAIVQVGNGKPDKLIESWMDLPGYRFKLMDPRLSILGVYAVKGIAVFEVTRGALSSERFSSQYPFGNQKEVPTEIDARILGADVVERLQQKGLRGYKLGFPLTLHFYGPGALRGDPEDYPAILKLKKDEVPGVVEVATSGTRRAGGEGLVVFYPLQPLKRGSEYLIDWTGNGKNNDLPVYRFTTR